MKTKYKYKNLIPLVLVIFMVLAWYQLISGSMKTTREYNSSLESARQFAKDGVIIDAVESYSNAIKIKDSAGVRKEIVDVYTQSGMLDEAAEAAEAMISAFPEDARSYECLMDLYLSEEMYGNCFSVYDRASKLGAVSNHMNQTISEIRYKYKVLVSGIAEVSMYSNETCAVRYGDNWGFMDEDGKFLTDAKYKSVGDFTSDRTFVETQEGEQIFIDKAGNKRAVLPEGIEAAEVGNAQGTVYPLASSDTYDYYNAEKNKLFGGFSDATTFANNYAAVLTDSGYGLIDSSGNIVGNSDYDKVACDERKVATELERAFFLKGSSWIMVGMDGAPVGSDTYEDAKPFYPDGSYAAVKQNSKWGFVDVDGKMVISPQFEEARSFSFGHAAVKQDGKWGFVDKSGKIVIEPTFEDARDMNSTGNIFVKENGAWQLISLYQYNY